MYSFKSNKGNYRVRSSAFIILLLLLTSFSIPSKSEAVISNGANAVDLIGQYTDSQTLTPIYTTGGGFNSANDGPNDLGFYSMGHSNMVIDSVNHRLFVSDSGNHRVLVFNLNSSNQLVDKYADNVLGQTSFKGNLSASTQIGVNNPTGLAYDSANNRLFVSEQGGNRVKIFDVTSITNGEPAVNVLGQTTFTGASSGNSTSTLSGPAGLVYDSANNRLFVVEISGNRVKIFDVASITDGEVAINILGQTTFTGATSGNSTSTLNSPRGLAYDSTGSRLFVSEASGHRVKIFNVATVTDGEEAIGILGQTTFTGASSGHSTSTLSSPQGLAYDSTGSRLFVSEVSGHRVKIFDAATTTNGQSASYILGQTTFTGATASSSQMGLTSPAGIAFDTTNNRLFVSESGASGNSINIFDVASITNGENAIDRMGQYTDTLNLTPSYTTHNINNGPNDLGFNLPQSDLAIDYVGHRLFVPDVNANRVLVFNLNSSNQLVDKRADFVLGHTAFNESGAGGNTQSDLYGPSSVVFDSVNNRLFVAEGSANRIKIFDVTSITNGENAINILGQSTYSGASSANTQTGLNYPFGLVLDSVNNRLFVTEGNANRVKVFNVNPNTIGNGDPAINILGQSTYSGASNGNSSTTLDFPTSLAFDPTGNRLFVSEYSGNRVKVFDVASITDGESAINVLGQTTFSGASQGDTQIGLNGPHGLAYDPATSRLFVAEENSHRVKVFDVASITDGESAINVLGQTTFTGASSAITQAGLYSPMTVLYDTDNDLLYVVEASNKIKIFDAAPDLAPIVSATTVSTTVSGATITWTTNETASSTVSYGLTSSYGSATSSDTLATSHSVALTGLAENTTYHYQISVSDSIGNLATTSDATFTTSATPTTTTTVNTNAATLTAYSSTQQVSLSANMTPTTQVPNIEGCLSGYIFNVLNGMRCPAGTTITTVTTQTPAQQNFKFTRNLSFGFVGVDVLNLQKYLNARLFTISTTGAGSSGKETTYFGNATRTALARFQTAKGIIPAVGFFGPVTRGFVNAGK